MTFAKRALAAAARKKKKESVEEVCVDCRAPMGYAATLYPKAPERRVDEARYIEGEGQLCGSCARERAIRNHK